MLPDPHRKVGEQIYGRNCPGGSLMLISQPPHNSVDIQTSALQGIPACKVLKPLRKISCPFQEGY